MFYIPLFSGGATFSEDFEEITEDSSFVVSVKLSENNAILRCLKTHNM